jgi:uncharacterized protein YdeI (YjbR/CyaY-like superfamily)
MSAFDRRNARPEYPVLLFADLAEWRTWLDANHTAAPGVWLRFAKKAASYATVTYAEALDVAPCYGR